MILNSRIPFPSLKHSSILILIWCFRVFDCKLLKFTKIIRYPSFFTLSFSQLRGRKIWSKENLSIMDWRTDRIKVCRCGMKIFNSPPPSSSRKEGAMEVHITSDEQQILLLFPSWGVSFPICHHSSDSGPIILLERRRRKRGMAEWRWRRVNTLGSMISRYHDTTIS